MTREEMIEALMNVCRSRNWNCTECPLGTAQGICIEQKGWNKCSQEELKRCYDIAFGCDEESVSYGDNAVEHPSHYTSGGIECIKAIEASMSAEEFQGYCKGNCIKYIWRYRQKNGVEDLRKAKVYLNWLIESLDKEEHT